jgi:hypothetical protein
MGESGLQNSDSDEGKFARTLLTGFLSLTTERRTRQLMTVLLSKETAARTR